MHLNLVMVLGGHQFSTDDTNLQCFFIFPYLALQEQSDHQQGALLWQVLQKIHLLQLI